MLSIFILSNDDHVLGVHLSTSFDRVGSDYQLYCVPFLKSKQILFACHFFGIIPLNIKMVLNF